MKFLNPLPVVALAVLFGTPALAETSEQKGLRIAQAISDGEKGFSDHRANGKMVLRTKGGRTSNRQFDYRSIGNRGKAGSRSLIVFKAPGDIRNTALLTHTHKVKKDDQWLYLPAVSKVRRISSSGKSGSFVGSEFAYEDMADMEVEKYSYNWIRDESCPTNGTCHVIDRFPKRSSGYSYQRVWVSRKNNRIQVVHYFDRRKAHLKTMTASGYKKYSGRYWRASTYKMNNHLTGKSTILTWSSHRFDTGISRNGFNVNALRRIR